MSGSVTQALAQATGAVRTAASLGQFLSSGFGSPGGVTLGPIELRGPEVPEVLTFGTTQAMTVHRLPGGQRVIDTMGPDPSSVVWKGFMLGSDAVQRAEAIHTLSKQGDLIDLLWGEYNYGVIVASFECDYRRSNWVGEYRISCTVVPDPPADDLPTQGVGEAIGDSIGAALGIDLPSAFSDGSAALGQAQRALGAAGAFIPGGLAATKLAGTLGQARDLISAGTALAEIDLARAGANITTGFRSALDAAGRMATGQAALGHVGDALVSAK